MLRRNASLEELNLSFNPVGDAGARGVAAALRKNRKLRSLQLRRAGLTDAGAQGIAEFLPKMAGLKELALDKNGIGADGMAALAEALMHNVELERLRVSEPPPPPPPSSSGPSSRQIAHWVRLNRAGRRVFRHSNAVDHRLWPAVYARAAGDADLLYHFLKSKPEAASVSA
jgi:Ran GTPase-activating protein (RanGAP) involved in mRNA processing and transport